MGHCADGAGPGRGEAGDWWAPCPPPGGVRDSAGPSLVRSLRSPRVTSSLAPKGQARLRSTTGTQPATSVPSGRRAPRRPGPRPQRRGGQGWVREPPGRGSQGTCCAGRSRRRPGADRGFTGSASPPRPSTPSAPRLSRERAMATGPSHSRPSPCPGSPAHPDGRPTRKPEPTHALPRCTQLAHTRGRTDARVPSPARVRPRGRGSLTSDGLCVSRIEPAPDPKLPPEQLLSPQLPPPGARRVYKLSGAGPAARATAPAPPSPGTPPRPCTRRNTASLPVSRSLQLPELAHFPHELSHKCGFFWLGSELALPRRDGTGKISPFSDPDNK